MDGTLARFLFSLALVAGLGACVEEVDRQAKKRIFSAEDPPAAVASAAESLNVNEIATSATTRRRIFSMGAAEMTERLGPHRYTANISFDWSQAGRSVRLEEKRSLKAGEGGVNGDFHALLENSRDLGLEVLRVNGRVYARSRYGKFRQRLRDRGMAERERDEVQGALRDVYSLFQGRMQLTPDGSVRLSGREALKFRVSLGQAADKGESLELPDAGFAKTGLDASSGLRLDFYNRREAKALQGDVWVDAETSVVLKAKLEGKLAVPREKGASLLRLSLSSQVSDFGKNPRLKAPTDFLPDEDKPQGIADALERFGYSTRLAPDAGTVNAPDDE